MSFGQGGAGLLPLYSTTSNKDKGSYNPLVIINTFVRTIVNSKSTRNVFFFLLLNISFGFVEVIYGLITNSLGLIGDGVHMFFDSSAIIFGLIASVIIKWPANDRYSYGYGRVETFAGFINTAALAYAALRIFAEAVERLLEPPEVKSEQLLTVAFLGFLVNMVGIFAFEHGGHGHSHGEGGHGHDHDNHTNSHDVHDEHSNCDHDHDHSHSHAHSHGNEKNVAHSGHETTRSSPLMQGMFLHVLADTMGSVGVIISALCIRFFGWTYADPICSLFLSILIFVSVLPLLRSSTTVLLQRCPQELDSKLNGSFQSILNIPGVIGFAEPHFWEFGPEKYVGTIRIQVQQTADEQKIRQQVAKIYKRLKVNDITVQVEKLGM